MKNNFVISPLTPAIGAEITGIDLSKPLSRTEQDALYKMLITHQVIFLRDQRLSPPGHLALAKSLGELEPPHPVYPHLEGFENIMLLANGPKKKAGTDCWHTDVTFKGSPPVFSVLVARELPPLGGDTLWRSMTAAYDNLPAGMKSDLEDLMAVHDMGDFRNTFTTNRPAGSADDLTKAHQRIGSAIHRVVQVHPVTGKRFLFVNETFTQHIIRLEAKQSDRLLGYLFDHINKPDYEVRFKWSTNTVAIWDNRCTQHYATADYFPQPRLMHRITISSDRRADAAIVKNLKAG